MKKIVYPKGLKLTQNLSEYELETYEVTIEQNVQGYGYDSVLVFPDIYLFSKLSTLSIEANRDKWMEMARFITSKFGDNEDIRVIFLGSSSAELFKNGNDWEVLTHSSDLVEELDPNLITLTFLLSDNREYFRLVSQLKLVCVSSYNVDFFENFKTKKNLEKLLGLLEDGYKVDSFRFQYESCMSELEDVRRQLNDLKDFLKEKEIQSKLSESTLSNAHDTARVQKLKLEEIKRENKLLNSTQLELQQLLEESNSLKGNYEHRIKELESAIKELKSELDKKCNTIEEYAFKNSDLEARLSDTSSLTESSKLEVEKFKHEVKLYSQEIERETDAKNKLIKTNTELREQLVEANCKVEHCESDIVKLSVLSDSYSASLDELRLIIKNYESVELEKNAIQHDYRFAIKSYENALIELHKIREAFNDAKRTLATSDDVQHKQGIEIYSLQQQIATKNRTLKTEQERSLNLEKAIEKQTLHYKSLTAKIDEKESEHKMFVDRQAKQVINLEEENKSLLEQLSSNQLAFATSLENKSRNIERLQTEKKETLSKLIVVSRDNTKLNNRFSKLKLDYNIMSYEKFLLERELDASSSLFGRAKGALLSIKNFRRKGAIESRQQDTSQIATSEYFDIEWYLRTYSDVKESGINPAEHYLLFGATEARMPSPHFDTIWYLERYPDVKESGINPLLHFIKYGQSEGRVSSPKLLERVGFEKK